MGCIDRVCLKPYTYSSLQNELTGLDGSTGTAWQLGLRATFPRPAELSVKLSRALPSLSTYTTASARGEMFGLGSFDVEQTRIPLLFMTLIDPWEATTRTLQRQTTRNMPLRLSKRNSKWIAS